MSVPRSSGVAFTRTETSFVVLGGMNKEEEEERSHSTIDVYEEGLGFRLQDNILPFRTHMPCLASKEGLDSVYIVAGY